METIVIPKYEYITMKQHIADLQKKLSYLQDVSFINKLKYFVDFFYKDSTSPNTAESPDSKTVEPLPFKYGVARDLIFIADDFNAPVDEFKEYL